MPTVRFSSCGSCGKGLGGRDAWPDIGAPFIECPRCGSLNKTRDGTTEWQFMPFGTRAVIVIKYALFGVAFGFLPVVAIALIAQARGINVDHWPVFTLALWSLPLGLAIAWVLIAHGVAQSRKRIANARYKSLVERFSGDD